MDEKNCLKVIKHLLDYELKISVAESCTGGLISQTITSFPGSSRIFDLGVVAYSNRMKTNMLGVSEETLKKFGAVSEETVLAMAKGLSRLSGADLNVAVSGISGPGGGTPAKPVGLVYICLMLSNPVISKTEVHEFRFSGNRTEIREQTKDKVFELLSQMFDTL